MPGSGSGGNTDDSMRDAFNAANLVGDDGTTSAVDPLADLPTRVRDFLRHPDVAQPLKDLCLHLIPTQDFAAFKARLDRGDFDDHLTCPAHPMGGLLAQLAAAPKELGNEWLQAVAQHEAFAVDALNVPYYYTGNAYVSSIREYSNQSVSHRTLGSWMIGHRSMKYLDVASFAPRLLAHEYRTNDITQPIGHHALYSSSISIELLQSYADATGSLDFIDVKNTAGENLFYRLATVKSWYNQTSTLNALSWMLDRRPDIANSVDAAGWTTLDRYVLQMTAQSGGAPAAVIESGVLRLLMSAGAQFRRQTPPGMSLVDYHNQQTPTVLGKPTSPLSRKP